MWRLICLWLIFGLLVNGASAAASVPQVVQDYIIGPEDVLQILVWKEEDLQRKVSVRPDGRISFPLIGQVQAAGKTVSALQQGITRLLAKFIPDPVVTVVLEQAVSYKIYVLGQVNHSGQFAGGQYLDVMQALALAGGLTPYAAENKIRVLRRENGIDRAIPFEYAKVKKGEKLEQNIILRRGDVVVVP